jgi:cysteine desulfurase
MEKRIIYADNAATTAVSEEVLSAMLPYFRENFGNPSSIYKAGRDARKAVEEAREKVAKAIGADTREVYFTSCGSESDNWAIKGAAELMAQSGKKHIVTSAIEHHAVLRTCRYLEGQGFEVTCVPVGADGIVRPEMVKKALRGDTALVSVMYANNEVGTIQPVAEIAELCRARGVLFHTDAVQAVGHVDIDVHGEGIDMLSLSGHKFHAPKGVGALYVRNGIRLSNLIHGGGQERGSRAGTENVPAIVGLGAAIEAAVCNISEREAAVAVIRNKLMDMMLEIPHTRLNGDLSRRLAGNLNISFEGIDGEAAALMLGMKGIYVSLGSACTTGDTAPSHVLTAMGLDEMTAKSALRFTIESDITDDDIGYMTENLKAIVEKLRRNSPLWAHIIRNDNT